MAADQPPVRTLWYKVPASETPWKQVHRSKDWRKRCLPIGNGNLGGMIFGGVARERIQFNEDSHWIGDEDDTGAYLAFADLYLEMDHADCSGYRRELDITRGVHTITYTSGDVGYRRDYFSSYPDKVMVLHFSADKKGACTGTVFLDDIYDDSTIEAADSRITLKGADPGKTVLNNGRTIETHRLRGVEKKKYDIRLAREAQVRVLHEGGSISVADTRILFEDVDSLTILLAADTDYINQRKEGWRGEHPHKRLTAQLDAASNKSFETLLADHIADHSGLYGRLSIDLGRTPSKIAVLPTDERMQAYRNGGSDPDLEALLFQYARYLMIACSRHGSLPANLQGLWNRSDRPPWRSDYHTDVNVQMNYWFVDKANLRECFEPYTVWLDSIREVRRRKTKAAFNARGWTMRAENGIFGGSTWKWVKPTAAWCAQNLWEHYAITQDNEDLRTRIYPIMKELCWFWEDVLKELPDGTLVSPDGISPEHGPEGVDGVAHDQQLVWDLFSNTIEAAEALGVDEAWRRKLAGKRDRLLGPQIGRWGQLQEWMEDIDDPKDKHRHLSHMIAVHPGRQVSPLTAPALADAAKVSMNARGDGSTGWSRAWKICIWARLHDGDRAYKILSSMMRSGLISDNLFDEHPPFQIDGNFGYAEGVCEMLVQSHMGFVHLLPALPDAWAEGRIKGVRVRGGCELDLRWKAGKLTRAVIRGVSNTGDECTVRYGKATKTFALARGASRVLTHRDFE